MQTLTIPRPLISDGQDHTVEVVIKSFQVSLSLDSETEERDFDYGIDQYYYPKGILYIGNAFASNMMRSKYSEVIYYFFCSLRSTSIGVNIILVLFCTRLTPFT